MNDLRLPADFQDERDGVKHVAIVGRNGTGKTVAALWHLSMFDMSQRPFVIVDPKGDSQLSKLGARRIRITDEVPREPDLYITSLNSDEEEQFSDFCSRVKKRGDCGVLIDEGHATRRAVGFQDLLSQGRSKKCPVIVITQRPVYISRFVWSECSLFQIYDVTTSGDRKAVEEFIPLKDMGNSFSDLKKRQSFWYDVDQKSLSVLGAVPPPDESIKSIRAQLRVIRNDVKKVRIL